MGSYFRLDQSNRQGRICPAFAFSSDWSNFAGVNETVTIESIRLALRAAMRRRGVKPTTLSQRVGNNKSLVKDLLEKTNDITVGTLTKLAGALDIPISDLMSAPPVPIAGRIGAGGTIIFEDLGPDETVMRPPGISGDLVALLVTGDSMLPKYNDGDIIYIQRKHDGVLEAYFGCDCAIRLTTGETYLKQLMRGSEPGRFTLISLNAPPMVDVEVEWATRVAFIMPSHSRHLFS